MRYSRGLQTSPFSNSEIDCPSKKGVLEVSGTYFLSAEALRTLMHEDKKPIAALHLLFRDDLAGVFPACCSELPGMFSCNGNGNMLFFVLFETLAAILALSCIPSFYKLFSLLAKGSKEILLTELDIYQTWLLQKLFCANSYFVFL